MCEKKCSVYTEHEQKVGGLIRGGKKMATTKLGKDKNCAQCGRWLQKGQKVYVKGGVGKTIFLGTLNLLAGADGGSRFGKFYCSEGCLKEALGK